MLVSKEFQTGVKDLLSKEVASIKASESLETSGKNLVSVITSEFILLKKQVVASPDSKLSANEQKIRESKKVLSAYETQSSYYSKCLEIAYKLMISKYDFIDFKSHSVSDLNKVVTLKPSKAGLKKDFKEELTKCAKAKATKQAKEAKANLSESLTSLVSTLSSEDLLSLKRYLTTNVSAKA